MRTPLDFRATSRGPSFLLNIPPELSGSNPIETNSRDKLPELKVC